MDERSLYTNPTNDSATNKSGYDASSARTSTLGSRKSFIYFGRHLPRDCSLASVEMMMTPEMAHIVFVKITHVEVRIYYFALSNEVVKIHASKYYFAICFNYHTIPWSVK